MQEVERFSRQDWERVLPAERPVSPLRETPWQYQTKPLAVADATSKAFAQAFYNPTANSLGDQSAELFDLLETISDTEFRHSRSYIGKPDIAPHEDGELAVPKGEKGSYTSPFRSSQLGLLQAVANHPAVISTRQEQGLGRLPEIT